MRWKLSRSTIPGTRGCASCLLRFMPWARAGAVTVIPPDFLPGSGNTGRSTTPSSSTASGNTAVKRDYSFIGHLETGSYQVRLKQVLKDGNFTYSAIRSLLMNSNSSLFSLSVHSRKIFITSTTSTNYHVKIFDLNGRSIVALSLRSRTGEIDLPRVTPGLYILSVNSEDGRRQAQKILIN